MPYRLMTQDTAAPKLSQARTFVHRLGSTLLLWVVVTGVFVSKSAWAFLGLTSLLVVIATWEYYQMLKKAGVSCSPLIGIFASTLYSGVLSWRLIQEGDAATGIDLFAVSAVAIGSFSLQLRRPVEGKDPIVGVALNVLGFVYIAVLFHFASRLIFLPDPGGELTTSGAFLLLWLVAVTKFTDMGAYITGSLIGKHKMIPHISPAKTWEGFVGALFFSQLAGVGLYLFCGEHLQQLVGLHHVIILGLILAALAVVGDLAESIVKRSLGAKDSGHMLPGIGGALDLIDSICFTAPAMVLYLICIQ